MKLKFLIFHFSFLILTACGVTKPVATTHAERIETNLHPIPVGADTIEIVLSHTDDLSHTECTDNTEYAVATPAEDRLINDFEQSEKSNSVSSVSSVRNKNSSVRDKNSSVRNKNSVRISSTRGVNISRHETDTTSTLRITLRPDTVFVPYTNHIRSDTIVVPDRICKTKLQKMQTANVLLILILIAIFIYSLRS
jgi:hypothetical protein